MVNENIFEYRDQLRVMGHPLLCDVTWKGNVHADVDVAVARCTLVLDLAPYHAHHNRTADSKLQITIKVCITLALVVFSIWRWL